MKDLGQRKNLTDGEYTGDMLVRANGVMLKRMTINGMIRVSAKRTDASAALLSWGLRTRAGTIAVP